MEAMVLMAPRVPPEILEPPDLLEPTEVLVLMVPRVRPEMPEQTASRVQLVLLVTGEPRALRVLQALVVSLAAREIKE